MRLLSILFTLLILGVFSWFLSCTRPPSSQSAKATLMDCTDCCDYLKQDSTLEISEKCATCMISNFEKNGDIFSRKLNDGKSTKGFLMRNQEINEFFEIIKQDSLDSKGVLKEGVDIFGMFGIYYGKSMQDTTKIDTSVHQIFVVEDNIDANMLTVSLYYNFVQPCPRFCPKNIGALTTPPTNCPN